MDATYWLISVGSIGILAASIALQIRTYSRRRPVRPMVIALGQAVAFGSMVLFSVTLGRPPGVVEWVLILSVGVACGTVYGGLVRVEQTPAGVVMAYTLPWLVVWGALLLVTQGAAAITGRLPWVIYSLAIFSMTLNLGMNGRVIARYRALRIGGVVVAALLAPLLASAFALAPTSVRPVLAASCSVDQVPDLLRGLLPPEGISGKFHYSAGEIAYPDHLPIVGIGYDSQSGDVFTIEVYRSVADAKAGRSWTFEMLAQDMGKRWEKIGDQGAVRLYEEGYGQGSTGLSSSEATFDYYAISGAAWIEVHHKVVSTDSDVRHNSNIDGLFLSVMAAAGALNPDAVFALAATDACAGVAPGTDDPGPAAPGTDEPVPDGSTKPAEPVPPDGTTGKPGDTSGSVSGIEGLLGGAPIPPGELTQGLLLANGLLLLGSVFQFLLAGGSLGGARPVPAGGLPRPGGPANGAPFGDGRVWYRAPWDVGGPVPMTPAEVSGIEGKLSQGLIWSATDGWVTPQQGAEYQAMRAHQLEVERAESARAAAESHQAIQAARDAQAAARQNIRNINRRAVIDIEMRESERQHADDMADLASAERVAQVGSALVTAGDLAAIGLGISGGPLELAARAGYRVLHGAADGWGSSIADGASIGETTKRIYIGTVEGGAIAGAELAFDAGIRKLVGLPPIFPAAPPPIPPSLLVPKAIMKQALGDAAEIAEREGIDAAARSVDPAKVLRLFKDGGMETLGQLEQAGAVSASEAQVIRKVLTNEMNTCVRAGTGEAAWEFAARTGVRVEEVLVGDSGSSAAGRAGSLLSDVDRTYLGSFHPGDLADNALKNGISPAEAASGLNRELTSAVDEKVTEQLGLRGLTPKDVGYTGYSGFGSTAGPADSYAAGFVRTTQAVQGKTLVVRPDGVWYVAGRDAILDAEGLAAHAQGVAMPPVQPTINVSEFGQLGGRQVESLIAHTDPKSVAKAMVRVTHLAGRSGIAVDSTAAAAAKAMRAEPQSVGEILESYGLTPEEFRTRALDTSTRFMTRLERFMTELKSPGQ